MAAAKAIATTIERGSGKTTAMEAASMMVEAASTMMAAMAGATGDSSSEGSTNGGCKGRQRWVMATVAMMAAVLMA